MHCTTSTCFLSFPLHSLPSCLYLASTPLPLASTLPLSCLSLLPLSCLSLLPTSSLVTDAVRPVNTICHSRAATLVKGILSDSPHTSIQTLAPHCPQRVPQVIGEDATCFAQLVAQMVLNNARTQIWDKHNKDRWRWAHSQMSQNTLPFSLEKGWGRVLTKVRKVLLRSMWGCVFALLSHRGEGAVACFNCNSQSVSRCQLMSLPLPEAQSPVRFWLYILGYNHDHIASFWCVDESFG